MFWRNDLDLKESLKIAVSGLSTKVR